MQRTAPAVDLCRCRAWVQREDDRAAVWTKIRGARTWPLLSPASVHADNGVFFRGRLTDLDRGQRQVLYEYVAHRRGGTIAEVHLNLTELGWIPIIQDGSVEIELCGYHRRPLRE
jgi:hypothetical protein